MASRKPSRRGQGFAAAPASSPETVAAGRPLKAAAARSGEVLPQERQAIAHLQAGRFADAELLYRRLLEHPAAGPAVFTNLAALCGLDGRHAEAIELLERAVLRDPHQSEALYNLGLAQQRCGNAAAAIEAFRRALACRPEDVQTLLSLASLLQEQGQPEQALELYRRVLVLGPDDPDQLVGLALLLQRLGDPAAAIQAYEQALVRRPERPGLWSDLGIALHQIGERQRAIAAFQRSLQLAPDNAATLCNLCAALQEAGDLPAAIAAMRQGLEARPAWPEGFNNLGAALQAAGEPAEAIRAYERCLALDPRNVEALSNLGTALQEAGDPAAALAAYDRAIAWAEDHVDAHHNRAAALFQLGDYAQGWQEYEWRWRQSGPLSTCITTSLPRWDGRCSIAGEPLLLVAEQGLGDTLQFARYARPLEDLTGAEVSLYVPDKLAPLLRHSGVAHRVVAASEARGTLERGHWLGLLSAPLPLGVAPDRPVVAAPYLRAPEERLQHWRRCLRQGPDLVVGIHWQGNPEAEKGGMAGRSLPLAAFEPLSRLEGVQLLSLQKGHGVEQLAHCGFADRFPAAQPQVSEAWDFLDAAAVVMACDLVITSDSMLAHLAAAQGQATWLLLHHVPSWRWGLEGESTFWYPSMRLFRQPAPGDWATVMTQVTAALQAVAAQARASGSS